MKSRKNKELQEKDEKRLFKMNHLGTYTTSIRELRALSYILFSASDYPFYGLADYST